MPLGGDGKQNLIPINIEDEMRRSYLDYAMSVIIGRALPDIRDGLKPVHRRILYAMSDMGLAFNRAYRKCAGIVGEVLGNYHPHGDASVYDALVRMAQDFSLRYPLVDGQGNFGSVDGDPPAAYRYTEARLSRIDTALLEDLDKETVDFRPNFDERRVEPEVLPTRVPNLLINGSSGIAVGMATNIPPHNLTEIINATILLVQKPDTHLSEIVNLVQGPDFPTGGFILGRQGILDYFTKGRGTLKLRAKAATEKIGKDREAIIVTEIPYQVNKARLIEATAGLVNEKKIEGISEIRDESDRDGMRIVFELKRGEQAEVILNNLYKHTQLQINFGVIMLSIVNGQPRELGLADVLRRFIDHRIDVVRRRTDYLLRKAREREHILLGFKKALENLDAVIKLIRASKTPREARDGLITHVRIHRAAGASHHRDAVAAPDRHGDREDPQGTGRYPGRDRRVSRNPGVRQKAARHHRAGAEGRPEGVRRRTPHPDHRRHRRDSSRRSDPGGRRRGHRHARRLLEAHRRRYLPAPVARRQGTHRHGHAHRGCGGAPGGRVHARLSAGVHHHGPRLLAEDLRNSRRRAPPARASTSPA